jgi:hypothetical protein
MRTIAIGSVLAMLGSVEEGLAQESLRDLEQPGEHTKYLTRDQVDRWRFEAQAGAFVRASVQSGEFDPTLRLVRVGEDGRETDLEVVDDDGSSSALLHRLAADGHYELRVHGYEKRGGGNYSLSVERFVAQEMPEDGVAARTDHEGRAFFVFTPRPGRPGVDPVVSWRVEGLRSAHGAVYDAKGRVIPDLRGVVRLEREAGPSVFALRGDPDTAFRARILDARWLDVPEAGATLPVRALPASGVDIVTFEGEVGEPMWLRLTADGRLPTTRFEFHGERPTGLDRQGGPDFVEIPVFNKGARLDRLIVPRRSGPFEFHAVHYGGPPDVLYALTRVPIERPFEVGTSQAVELAVGGTWIAPFDVETGDVVVVNCGSAAFDPVLRVLRPDGSVLLENDDGGDAVAARARFVAQDSGRYLLACTSLGGGGGGEMEVAIAVEQPPVLTAGATLVRGVGVGERLLYVLEGDVGSRFLLRARAAGFVPELEILGPDGRILARSVVTGSRDAVLSVRLETQGRHLLTIAATGGGGGEFSLRRIEDE